MRLLLIFCILHEHIISLGSAQSAGCKGNPAQPGKALPKVHGFRISISGKGVQESCLAMVSCSTTVEHDRLLMILDELRA